MPGMKIVLPLLTSLLACLSLSGLAAAQAEPPKKVTWKSVEFAIVRFNDQAPNSWSIYHSEKKGVLLVRLWKRYMLVKIQDEEVYDIDPQKISVHGSGVAEFACGVQRPARKIQVVHDAKPDAKLGTAGDVRVVEFPQ